MTRTVKDLHLGSKVRFGFGEANETWTLIHWKPNDTTGWYWLRFESDTSGACVGMDLPASYEVAQ